MCLTTTNVCSHFQHLKTLLQIPVSLCFIHSDSGDFSKLQTFLQKLWTLGEKLTGVWYSIINENDKWKQFQEEKAGNPLEVDIELDYAVSLDVIDPLKEEMLKKTHENSRIA